MVLGILNDGERNADVVNEACLTTTDLAQEWRDNSTARVRDGLRESEAIVGIKEGAGLAIDAAAGPEQSWIQAMPGGGSDDGR